MKLLKRYRYAALPILLSVILFGFSYKPADSQVESAGELAKSDSVVLVFAGDVMGHIPQQTAAFDKTTGTYDFTPCYQYIAPYIESADLAIANLEIPLAGKPYSGYPQFSGPDELLYGALSAGFDVMQLANNHIADKGKIGIERTYNTVNRKIKSVGIYLNPAQRDSLYPLLLDVNGLKLALLNCTFGTNGREVSAPFVVNTIDTVQIRKDIKTARERGAQCVIMTIHWGTEYEPKANDEQVKLANFMVKAGVDAIIGAHPHVVQNFDLIRKNDSVSVPVFYSLGNMISNQRWRHSNGGILARIVLSKSTGKVLKTAYLPFFVHKGTLNGKFQYYLIPTEKYLSKLYPFQLPASDDSMLVTFDNDTRLQLNNVKRWR